MQFKNIVGLDSTKQHLINLVAQDRIPHAIMMNGSKGNGSLPLAIAFAQYIMCTNKGTTDACGECSNCLKFSKLQHIDVHYSFPVISDPDLEPLSVNYLKEFRASFVKNAYLDITTWLDDIEAGNKQANISAKECRDIIRKIQLRSFEGGYKFLIMWLPEFLGKEGNILLKLIEEPPAQTVMIFVTENYDNVLGTIQSRTQLINLPPLQDAEIANALIANGVAEKTAMQIARITEGNYTQALQAMHHEEESHFAMFRDWLNVLFTNNGPGITNWVMAIAEKPKETQKQYLSYVVTMMEHLIRTKWVGKENLLLHPEEDALLEKMILKNITEEKANEIAQFAADNIYAIERNANSKIVFHSLSLQVKDVFAGKSLYL